MIFKKLHVCSCQCRPSSVVQHLTRHNWHNLKKWLGGWCDLSAKNYQQTFPHYFINIGYMCLISPNHSLPISKQWIFLKEIVPKLWWAVNMDTVSFYCFGCELGFVYILETEGKLHQFTFLTCKFNHICGSLYLESITLQHITIWCLWLVFKLFWD